MGEFKLDFTGIGMAKAGTSWIARCLEDHPSICMASGKETNFFLRKHFSSSLPFRPPYDLTAHYNEGLEWYVRKFSHHGPGQLYGEFSNAYIADPESASLLRAHNPGMKLLCCFRNPADTAYAGYSQLSRVLPLPDTVEEFLSRYPALLEYGRYYHNLQPFLKLFPRERFHLMLFDDIQKDPVAFYRGICEFLEIDSSFVPETVSRRVNPRTVLRSRLLRNLRCAIGDVLASTASTRMVRGGLVRLGAARLAYKVIRLNEKPGKGPPMALETRRRLVEFFRKDNELLEKFLDRDLSHWNECRNEGAVSESRLYAGAERSLSLTGKPIATIGILTYHSKDLLKGLLESILGNRWEYSYEIVVVDNNSADDTVSMIETRFPSVRLVKNPENVGVARARNQIFRMSECEFVIILDVDTVVHPESLDTLVRSMRKHPEAGIAGPKLVYGDGRLQHSCRPFPSPWNIAIEGTFLRDWFPRSRFVREYTLEDWDHGELREVDWMYGAAWILRKTVLDRVGHFDEGFFYLYEDIDLCFRVKKHGFKILYEPQAVVTHFLPRERKGIFHNRIGVHCRSILRYLLKDYLGLPLRTQTSASGS